MGNQEDSAPPPPPPPSGADMNADQKLYVLNALQVVGDWSVHDDGDGRLFYYDHKTNASQWEAPDSLASLETEFMMKLMLQNAVAISGVWTAHDTGNGTLYYFNSKTRESVWERPGEWGATEAAAAEERDRQKITELAKNLREEEEQKSKEEKAAKKEKRKHKKQKEKRDAEVKAKENEHTQEEVEEEVPLTAEELQAKEERKAREMKRIEQFRAMLRDKNIMPFCKWSVALPQIAGDPRFMGVPTMDERRAIFEHFVEHRREDLKAEKKGKLKQAKKLFTNLLREQFQLDSWEPSTTFSVFLSTLESNIDSQRYKQIQNDALVLLTLSTQEKIYTKAVEEYKSEELKRDGEQLRLAKFLEDKLNVHDKTAIAWEDDGAQKLVREFYASAASTESTPLLSELKQKRVFEDLVARLNTNEASSVEDMSHKQLERSFSRHRSSPRRRSRSNEHKPRESNPRHEPRHSRSHRRRSRSHSRRRRSRSDSRSQSRERSRRNRSSRRRSASSSRSRSRSREERSSGRSSRYHRHRSKSRSRTRR
ncbi:Transcription elongation regulator 1 [Phytophthora citrophthora]|uniref:Transcription elongation regulator 1 n=1 Tax=Phytophthora citrophthora TaxID=4793 RepID=A0AAD9GV37_9STRA|nr:Transcription elongation regulator 1 [Phytophthora citrophthora]